MSSSAAAFLMKDVMSENAELDRSLKIVAERMNRLRKACKLVKAQKEQRMLWDEMPVDRMQILSLQRALKALHEILGEK
jgi:predicted  nucleic acid-binding Zn-ribbon protein